MTLFELAAPGVLAEPRLRQLDYRFFIAKPTFNSGEFDVNWIIAFAATPLA
jgi:hypothetical protein